MITIITVVPALAGTLFWPAKKESPRIPFYWVSGQILLWALFQVMCVPMVLTGLRFQQARLGFFLETGAVLLMAGVVALFRFAGNRSGMDVKKPEERKSAAKDEKIDRSETGLIKRIQRMGSGRDRWTCAVWMLFGILVFIQLALVCVLSYSEGDDAFYVAITTYAKEKHGLYTNDPYTGGYMDWDRRHGLAPLPIWEAVLADLSGLSGAAFAHVVMPLMIIPMAYCIFFLIATVLFDDDGQDRSLKTALFMCFSTLLVMFGGYSVYSAENFLLVRAGQGKAVLANVILPMLLFTLIRWFRSLEKGQHCGFGNTALLWCLMIAGCLCSTQASLLTCMIVGVAALVGSIMYHRISMIIWAAAGMIIPGIFAFMYMVM